MSAHVSTRNQATCKAINSVKGRQSWGPCLGFNPPPLCSESFILPSKLKSNVREQKPRFLYLCGTTNQHFTTTTIFIVRDETTFQAAILLLTENVDIHCRVILRKPKEASFHVKKKTKFFIQAGSPHQATTYAGTTQCHLVFLILSIIILFKHAPKYPLGTSVTPWRLCMKQDNWLMRKGHLKSSKVDLTFDS